MMPYIMDGDYAVVTRRWNDRDLNGKILAARTFDGMILKRLLLDLKKRYMALVPLNPNYPVIEYNEDSPEYTIVGLLVLVVRQLIGE